MSECKITTAFGTAREEWVELVETWKQRKPEEFEDDHLPEVKARALSMDLDPTLLFLDVLYVRKLLSVENNPPIDTIFEAGCCEPLIRIANSSADNKLVFEALWAVTNLASGTSEQTEKVVQLGGIECFAKNLITTTDDDVFEQATWGLGNISGDSAHLRDLVLATEIPATAYDRFQAAIKTGKLNAQRNFIWMISNMCRAKPPPPLEVIRPLIPVLQCALDADDEEVRTDAVWAFSYISDGPHDRGAWLLLQCPNLATTLSQALGSSSARLIKPSIRTVGNLLTGTDTQTQMVLDQGVLDHFPAILRHPQSSVRKEACWGLSNVAAGPPEQVNFILDPSILVPLLRCCFDSALEVKKEAFWALNNTASSVPGSQMAADAFMDFGAMSTFVHGLLQYDQKINSLALQALGNILASTPKTNGRWPMFEYLVQKGLDAEFIEALKALLSHSWDEVKDEAKEILDTYFKID